MLACTVPRITPERNYLLQMLWLEPRSKQGVMRKLRQGVQHEFSRLESERPELRLSSGETLAGEWQRVPGTLMCFTTAPNASDSHVGNARYKLVMSHISPR